MSKLTRRIHQRKISKQHRRVQWAHARLCRLDRAPDEVRLARDADGVQHEEGVVPQPVQRVRWVAARGQRQREVRVPDHLGRRPRQQHRRVRGRRVVVAPAAGGETERKGGEQVDYSPDDGVPAEYLHEGRDEGGADDA